jgi:hypothetical protein
MSGKGDTGVLKADDRSPTHQRHLNLFKNWMLKPWNMCGKTLGVHCKSRWVWRNSGDENV